MDTVEKNTGKYCVTKKSGTDWSISNAVEYWSTERWEVWTQVHWGQTRWRLLDLHNVTHTHTNTQWWHNSSMPGVQLVACSLALTVSSACVYVCVCAYPVLPLCERGPLFTSLCCQLGTQSQDKTVYARTHIQTHTRTLKNTHTHTTLCCLLFSLCWEWKGAKQDRSRRAN